MNSTPPANGPTGREWGEIVAELRSVTERLEKVESRIFSILITLLIGSLGIVGTLVARVLQ